MKKDEIDNLIESILAFAMVYLIAFRELAWNMTSSTDLLTYGFILPMSIILTSIMLLPIIQGFVLFGMLIYDIFKSR